MSSMPKMLDFIELSPDLDLFARSDKMVLSYAQGGVDRDCGFGKIK